MWSNIAINQPPALYCVTWYIVFSLLASLFFKKTRLKNRQAKRKKIKVKEAK